MIIVEYSNSWQRRVIALCGTFGNLKGLESLEWELNYWTCCIGTWRMFEFQTWVSSGHQQASELHPVVAYWTRLQHSVLFLLTKLLWSTPPYFPLLSTCNSLGKHNYISWMTSYDLYVICEPWQVDSSASPAPGFPNSLQSQLPSHSALDRFEERHRRQYSGTCLHLRSNMDEKCIRDVINGNPVTVLPDLKAG